MPSLKLASLVTLSLSLLSCIEAQLNPADAPWTTWNTVGLNDHDIIVSTINADAYATDTKNWDLLSQIFTHDAVASYGADSKLSHGLHAIREVHIEGTKGFISQHLLSNFQTSLAEDKKTANATCYAIATLFTNPQQTSGQYVSLYGYYNHKMVKTTHGWRIKYLEYRFFGPGYAGNLTILPPDHAVAPPCSYEPPGKCKNGTLD